MTTAAFRDWARAEALESWGELDEFAGTCLAIDAEEYLNSVLTTAATSEPLLPALGGLPFALEQHIDQDLKRFRDAKIEPLFIFNGIELAVKDSSFQIKESQKTAKILDDAWNIYDQGRGEEAVVAFGKAGTYKTRHIIRWLQAHLHRVGIFTQVAPYNAAAQIVSLLENEDDKTRVDGACGSASLLVFGADQVITHFDWEAKRVYWVQLDTCLEKLRLQPDQFNDLMLLSGTSILPPIPEIDVDTPISKIVAARNLLSRANMSGYTACQQAHAEEYLLAYQKAIFAIKHAVSMDPKGTVQTKDAKNIPLDGHEFLGQKLPEEIYLYISRGLVGPQVLNGRTKSQILETSPLDGGSSQAYRDLVRQKLNPIRVQTLALLSQPLHRWYSRTDVTLTCWFDNEKKPLGVPDATNSEPSASADTWHIQEADIVGGEGDDFSTSPIQFAINMLSNETSAKKTVTPKSGTTALKTKKEILSNTVWRFLHDRGYINPDHTLSAWGKAVKAGLDQARKSGYPHEGKLANEAEEAILMAFELLRLDALNAKQMFSSPPYSGAPARGSDVDKANTLLISRIACLATLNHKSIGYTGPLSRHLLAYHQMAAAVRNSLRDLLEVHANNMELSGAVDRKLQPQDMTDVSASYPFTREPDLGLALAVKCFLDEQSQEPPSGENVMKWFEHATDVFKDLDKAWKLFSAVNAGIQGADSSIVNNETRKMFKNADEWLQRKRKNVHTTNGTT